MTIFFPYILVRSFAADRPTLENLLRTMTLLGAFVAVLTLVETRLFVNYFDELLRRVWPTYVMWDTGMVMSPMPSSVSLMMPLLASTSSQE